MNNQPSYGVKQVPFLTAGSIPRQYPWLGEDQYCDVCVVGGGVTGALCALRLAEKGRSVVLITSHEIGFGDTAALPAWVSADGGTTLTELTRRISVDDAVKLYSLELSALDELENLCHSLDATEGQEGFACDFRRRDCLLFTDDQAEWELLNREFLARRHNGFACAYIGREQARDSFSFDLCGGILCKEFAATLNPYHLTHLCLMRAERLGACVFEHTSAVDIQTPGSSEGSVIVTTAAHRTVYADKLILATGSEGIDVMFSRRLRRAAYCAVSRPVDENAVSGWPGQCLIRTFGTPEDSYSFTPDGRIAAVCGAARRLGVTGGLGRFLPAFGGADRQLERLEESVRFLFPAIPGIRTAFAFEHRYCVAPDGLPIIGTHKDYHNCIFALCSGSGTLVQAQLAAQTAADITESLFRDDMAMFSPMRPSLS